MNPVTMKAYKAEEDDDIDPRVLYQELQNLVIREGQEADELRVEPERSNRQEQPVDKTVTRRAKRARFRMKFLFERRKGNRSKA